MIFSICRPNSVREQRVRGIRTAPTTSTSVAYFWGRIEVCSDAVYFPMPAFEDQKALEKACRLTAVLSPVPSHLQDRGPHHISNHRRLKLPSMPDSAYRRSHRSELLRFVVLLPCRACRLPCALSRRLQCVHRAFPKAQPVRHPDSPAIDACEDLSSQGGESQTSSASKFPFRTRHRDQPAVAQRTPAPQRNAYSAQPTTRFRAGSDFRSSRPTTLRLVVRRY